VAISSYCEAHEAKSAHFPLLFGQNKHKQAPALVRSEKKLPVRDPDGGDPGKRGPSGFRTEAIREKGARPGSERRRSGKNWPVRDPNGGDPGKTGPSGFRTEAIREKRARPGSDLLPFGKKGAKAVPGSIHLLLKLYICGHASPYCRLNEGPKRHY
jgi:hypothetical protein